MCTNKTSSTFTGEQLILRSKKNSYNLLKSSKISHGLRTRSSHLAGPEQVLEYLGRYTHRVAITNNRLTELKDDNVTFTYRDRSDENKNKSITVSARELIRRYLLHILPTGFMKIRYYGFLASANKKGSIPLIQRLIDPHFKNTEKQEETIQEVMLRLTGNDISRCPECGKGEMIYTDDLPVPLKDSS